MKRGGSVTGSTQQLRWPIAESAELNTSVDLKLQSTALVSTESTSDKGRTFPLQIKSYDKQKTKVRNPRLSGT